MPLSLGGLSDCRARACHRARQGAGHRQASVGGDRPFRPGAAPRGPVQIAGRRRDARLGRRAHRARCGRARPDDGVRYARRAAQISGRYCAHRRLQGEGTGRRSARRAAGGGMTPDQAGGAPPGTAGETPAVPDDFATGRLAENILYFARALRAAGIPVGPGAVIDALEAVKAAGVGERQDFYWTLHAVFVKKHEHSALFDQAFRIFFPKRGYLQQMMAMMMPQAPRAARKPEGGAARVQEALFAGLKDKIGDREHQIEIDRRLTVSDREVLQRKDFAQMSAAEIARAKEAISHMVLSLDASRVRALAPAPRRHLCP